MNTQMKRSVGRRRIVLSLAVATAMAGVVWFSAMGGASVASADGGVDVGSTQHPVEQQYTTPEQPGTCFFGIPC